MIILASLFWGCQAGEGKITLGGMRNNGKKQDKLQAGAGSWIERAYPPAARTAVYLVWSLGVVVHQTLIQVHLQLCQGLGELVQPDRLIQAVRQEHG